MSSLRRSRPGPIVLGALTLTIAASVAGPPVAVGQLLMNGAGATFPYPIYSKWFDEYAKVDPGARFNYQSIGSGGGIRQITARTVDFGATDGPMTDEQLKAAPAELLHIPTVLGAVVTTYNLPGSPKLRFVPDVLADVFLGKITKWNDPRITGANPGISLPDQPIVVVHRSDGSGTTYIWVDYLSKVSREWEQKVGRGTSVNWPVGLGGAKSDGVAGLIKQTPNSIGYIELTYAIQNKLAYGKVKNEAGAFVKADLATVTAAAAGAAANMPADFRVSIVNAPGKNAYPISTFTWLLIPSQIKDPAKQKSIKDFLTWMLGPGQKMAEALDYAALPSSVVAQEKNALAKVQ